MKKLVNIVLVLCVAGMGYICVGSIMGSINFGKVREAREKEIMAEAALAAIEAQQRLAKQKEEEEPILPGIEIYYNGNNAKIV